MKNKFAALIAATFVATSASAGGFENQVFANENVKAIELSQTEMKDTQGEWLPIVAGALMGANAGAWNQHIHSINKNGRPATHKELVKPMVIGGAIGTGGAALGAASGGGLAGAIGWMPATQATNFSAQMIYNNTNNKRR